MTPPAVNAPFRDPDFGSRMVRVTDANALSEYGSNFTALSFMTDSSQEQNTWGVFDPSLGVSGGYRFIVTAINGGIIPYTLDATTMNVSRLSGQPGSYLNTYGTFDFGSAAFSYVNPDILYGMSGTRLMAYNFSTGEEPLVYDFANCPGLPSYVSQPWMYQGEPNLSTDDTKFSDYFGGVAQGDTTLVTFYDRTANNGAGACYWYDTQTGMVGGTNMPPTPVANQVGQLPPPPAPVVTPNPGFGSLPAGTYYVKITAVTRANPADGETTPSPEEGPIYLSAPGSLTITLPSQLSNPSELAIEGSGCNPYNNSLSGCAPFNVYIGTAPGGETLQNTQGPVGAAYSQTSPLVANSASPPSQSTAGYNVHGARLSRDGSYLRVDDQESQTVLFWQPGTNQVTTCLFIANSCGGHMALGYSHLVNDPNDSDMAQVVIRPLSNLGSLTELVNPLPTPPQYTGSHWTWNDDNPSDTMPVCGSFYAGQGAGQGDGTLSLLTNPLLQITAVYDREIVCVATTGPSKVWRFAHTRASTAWNAGAIETSNFWATPRGNVSQDGKFYMFTSDWEWSLGDEQGTSGCPFSGECRTDVFIVELH